jgi:hypothetical protein
MAMVDLLLEGLIVLSELLPGEVIKVPQDVVETSEEATTAASGRKADASEDPSVNA